MSEQLSQSAMERWQKEIEDRNERIRKLEAERDIYAAQAKWNAETVDAQREEIRRLERLVGLLAAGDGETHEEFIERFGL